MEQAALQETLVLKKAPRQRQKLSAEGMGALQRDISISEFFTKNRHLLGFDNASRALLTAVKEAVDNSLDACEEAGILPEIEVRIEALAENRFAMHVEDNGPGIIKAQIPKVFGKLLYGSKFHRLKQARGQQGIGISAAGMYGQLTTGKPVVVVSKIGLDKPAHRYQIVIDTTQNKPVIEEAGLETTAHWEAKPTGTSVRIEMEALYKGGKRSVDEYLQQVAFANPHMRLVYYPPAKAPVIYPRMVSELPPETRQIKPHPYGIELGVFVRMARETSAKTLGAFLKAEFCRVSSSVVSLVCKTAQKDSDRRLAKLDTTDLEQVFRALAAARIMAPPTDCLAPIGEAALLAGLKALLVQRHFSIRAASQDAQGQLLSQEHVIIDAVAKLTEDMQPPHEDEELPPLLNADGDGGESAELASAERGRIAPSVIDVFGSPCFITSVTRAPKVYRGNPFQVEAALAYGGELDAEELASVQRFANRVPLLFQQGGCAMTQAVLRTNWRGYGVPQGKGALPTGPLLILVHVASVWVPFTSEAKEAVAPYDEIIAELRAALQECGRRLGRHLRRRARLAEAGRKQKYIERYIPHVGDALQAILKLSDTKRDEAVVQLTDILERTRKVS